MNIGMSILLRCVGCVFLLPIVCLASEYDFTIEVPGGKMSCFFQSVTEKKYHAMEIDFQVIDGGDLNINFLLLLSGRVLKQDRMKSDNSHRVSVKADEEKGEYQLCFDNSFSYTERKVVFFEIFLYDQNNQLDEIDYSGLAFGDAGEGPVSQQAAQVTQVANRVKTALNKAEHYQSLLRAWEARDRAIMDANLSRVQWWSVVNSVALITAGFVQVYMIRSLFEENSKLGRLLRK